MSNLKASKNSVQLSADFVVSINEAAVEKKYINKN